MILLGAISAAVGGEGQYVLMRLFALLYIAVAAIALILG